MLTDILDFLASIIEGGFLGQAILATIIWGTVAVILIQHNPVDDRLYDAGFIILGYFFHVAQVVASSRAVSVTKRKLEDCPPEGTQ